MGIICCRDDECIEVDNEDKIERMVCGFPLEDEEYKKEGNIYKIKKIQQIINDIYNKELKRINECVIKYYNNDMKRYLCETYKSPMIFIFLESMMYCISIVNINDMYLHMPFMKGTINCEVGNNIYNGKYKEMTVSIPIILFLNVKICEHLSKNIPRLNEKCEDLIHRCKKYNFSCYLLDDKTDIKSQIKKKNGLKLSNANFRFIEKKYKESLCKYNDVLNNEEEMKTLNINENMSEKNIYNELI